MTLLGKVFIYLILVLSVIFFSLSVVVNSTHIRQKERAAEFESRAAAAQSKNDQLTKKIEELRQALAIERVARRASLAALQTELLAMEKDLEQKTAKAVEDSEKLTLLSQTVEATTTELKARTADNELLRKQIASAENNLSDVLTRYVAAKDEQNQLAGKLQTLKLRSDQINEDYIAAKEQLEYLDVDEKTQLAGPPPVNGQVLAVATNGLVEVSLGRDDGIREGFTLDVTRRGQYLGRLRITTVRDDMSVGEILTGFQQGVILQGDRVDSKLY